MMLRIEKKVTRSNITANVRDFSTKMAAFGAKLVMRQALIFKAVAQEGSTGEMKESIGNPGHKYGVWEVSKKGLSIKVGSKHPAVMIVETGAKKHLIKPKSPSGTLRFKDKSGNVIFRKQVNHPGFKGKFFMAKAAREAKRIRLGM